MIDLDPIERYAVDFRAYCGRDITPLVAELRAARKVVEAAQELQNALNDVLDVMPPRQDSLPQRRRALDALLAYSVAMAQ
jgi:hypothetical protein